MISEDISVPVTVTPDPFTVLRGRAVLGRMALALLATIALAILIARVDSVVFASGFGWDSALSLSILGLSLYGFLVLLILRLLKRAELHPSSLLGRPIVWKHLRRCWTLPLLLIGVSVTTALTILVPLSFAMPQAVEWLLRPQPPLIDITGPGYHVTNVLQLLATVVAAPIVEEYVFRGILLTRWSLKWSTPRAILLTSAIFGLLHLDVLGAMFFGYVMAVLYIKTRSLFVPIVAHAVNNAIAWTGGLLGTLVERTGEVTVTGLQAVWPAMLFFAVIFIPLTLRFIRRHFPTAEWKVPYLTLMKSEAASSASH